MIREYVLGLAFDPSLERVVLIHKNRPDWQRGLVNGIGGKVETEDDCILSAMKREAYEEADIAFKNIMIGWTHYLDMTGQVNKRKHWIVHCFYAILQKDAVIKSKTDEQVSFFHVDNLPENMVPHLQMNIQLALLAFQSPIMASIDFQ